MALDPRLLLKAQREAGEPALPLAGSRAARLQRVQIGLFGLGSMILLVALADIVITRARITEASVSSEAVARVEAPATGAPRDPLADAGVVPDLPAEPSAAAAPLPPDAVATGGPNAAAPQ